MPATGSSNPPRSGRRQAIWGYALRRRGLTVKTVELLIATYALSHGAELLTLDSDLGLMRAKGVPLQLIELGA